jgi:hypothetical protein
MPLRPVTAPRTGGRSRRTGAILHRMAAEAAPVHREGTYTAYMWPGNGRRSPRRAWRSRTSSNRHCMMVRRTGFPPRWMACASRSMCRSPQLQPRGPYRHVVVLDHAGMDAGIARPPHAASSRPGACTAGRGSVSVKQATGGWPACGAAHGPAGSRAPGAAGEGRTTPRPRPAVAAAVRAGANPLGQRPQASATPSRPGSWTVHGRASAAASRMAGRASDSACGWFPPLNQSARMPTLKVPCLDSPSWPGCEHNPEQERKAENRPRSSASVLTQEPGSDICIQNSLLCCKPEKVTRL